MSKDLARAKNGKRRKKKPLKRKRYRIHDAIRRVEGELPELAAHLRNSIRTGRVCLYTPERPVRWVAEPWEARAPR